MPQGAREKISRSFIWLNATQFFGALNDNFFQLLLIFALSEYTESQSSGHIVALAGAIFVVPFLLFSALAGVLADRISKQRIISLVKKAEVFVMILGMMAFAAQSPIGLLAVLFLMCTQSAFFSPSKYGVVPELVPSSELSRANSYIEMFTYLAIILGTVLASFISDVTERDFMIAAQVCIGVSILGLLSSFGIEKTPASGSTSSASWFFVKDIWRTLRSIRKDGPLLTAVIASAYFMMIGAFMKLYIIPYGIDVLHLTEEHSGYLFFMAAVGIGVGAVLAGILSGRSVEFGVVPLGAFGLTLSALLLSIIPGHVSAAIPVVLLLGVSAGLFIVPVHSFVQMRSPRDRLGEILAASSFLGWIGVLVASATIKIFSDVLEWSPRQGFFVVGLLTLILTTATLKALPDFVIRFAGVVFAKIFYRIKVLGEANLPLDGPALLVSNHVSYVDALLINAIQHRRIRFIMHREVYENKWLRPIFELMGVIPISFEDSPKQIVASLKAARQAMDDGFAVCIFAEGALTRSGLPREFKPGLERIVRDTDYPIIPIYLGGVWGSVFSYFHGSLLSSWPRQIPYRVSILIGKALPSSSKASDVRQAVIELSCEYFKDLKATRKSLAQTFIKKARSNWRCRAVSDSTGKDFTYGDVLVGSLAIGPYLKRELSEQERVGIMLPPSVGAVIANVALTLLGKTPVNLNFTAPPAAIDSAIEQCGISTVITSRLFLKKWGSTYKPPGALYMEEIRSRVKSRSKQLAWLQGRLLPLSLFPEGIAAAADELATILFSSGSTGEPKGIMLSHHNLISNVEALAMVCRVRRKDHVTAALPFFHSFGLTGTLWFPLLNGFSVTYHANALEGEKIAELVRENRSTFIMATPTILTLYMRRARAEDFKSLKYVVVGAEKMNPRIAHAFEKKFGLWPLEGYGATELSPVATINVRDIEAGGVMQVGAKEGSVGHPLPGVAVKICDDDGRALVTDEEGHIYVKGPNVMLGYLDRPDQTAEVLHDGWYQTGDIGKVDIDGFLFITDRESRFSKIGGEMVPHIAIEDLLQQGLQKVERVVVVTAVTDEKKGERLVVLFTPSAGPLEKLLEIIEQSELPNLWRPNPSSYIPIESIPLLGTGKVDLTVVKEIAQGEDGEA